MGAEGARPWEVASEAIRAVEDAHLEAACALADERARVSLWADRDRAELLAVPVATAPLWEQRAMRHGGAVT